MKTLIALSLVSLALPHLTFGDDDWLQWRGPNRDGMVKGAEWPDKLGEGNLTKLWNLELDKGYPGPLITSDSVLVVETADAKEEVVRSLSRDAGKEKWEARWAGSMKVPFFAAKNGSWVRSTPASDGERIYVGGMKDRLVAVNIKDGTFAWNVDFTEREGTPVPSFGFASSPLVDGDAVYVLAGCAVTKINAKTGETIWRAMEDKRAMYGSAFSSPVIATICGKRQLVAQTRSTLGGIDLETGEVLWSYEVKAFRNMNILTPTVIGDQVFTATYGGGSSLFEVRKSADGLAVEKLWGTKTEGYMSSPIAIGDYVYLHGRDKKLRCISLETGRETWVSDEKFGEYWSSVSNGSKILALDSDGELILLNANPKEMEILGRLEVSPDSPTWAHLAISGDEVFVRDLTGVTAYSWK